MPYDFWIPTEPDEWIRATLTEDGELVIHDYDLEPDLALEALGDEPSPVLRAIILWEENPIGMLCGKEQMLPLQDNGIAAWAWARLAINECYDDSGQRADPRAYAILDNALETALLALITTQISYKKLITAQKNVAILITKRLSFHLGDIVDEQTGAAMHAVKLVLNGIVALAQNESILGKNLYSKTVTNSFCNAGHATSKSLFVPSEDPYDSSLYDMLIATAIGVMGDVQKARGGPQL